MTIFKSGPTVTILLFAVLIIAGCASQRNGPTAQPTDPAIAAAQAMAHSDYSKAVQYYMQAASHASNSDEQRQYRFKAAVAAAQGGDVDTAKQLFASINPDTLNQNDKALYKLAKREIAIANLPPSQALAKLPAPTSSTPSEVAQLTLEKRADLYFADHEPVRGISTLVKRDALLKNKDTLHANEDRIYDESMDAVGLGIGPNSRAAEHANQTTRGWLALAQIGQRQFADDQARNKALVAWQQEYPNHPANRSVLQERLHYQGATEAVGAETGQFAPPSTIKSAQVAIVLPLSGRFKNAAQAIRDGFMFAYENNPAGMPKPVVYDSQSMSAEQIVAHAQSDNVGILVGPLLKNHIEAIASASDSLPEIALNVSNNVTPRPGLYQFALAPEDDARSVAAHAMQNGLDNALVLIPHGNWGDRVLDAFRGQLTAEGGHVVAYKTYDGNSHDHTRAIQALLQHKQSANFIFVAAPQPVQARLIRSQLKYYHAGSLPMVTTSHAYAGVVDTTKDVDLNGVHFVDIPWLLGTGGTIARLRHEADSDYKTEATQFARPFAFGMDGWLLARRLYHGQLNQGSPIEGMTGILSIQPNGHIRRYLGWAVFQGGQARTLSMPTFGGAKSLIQGENATVDEHSGSR